MELQPHEAAGRKALLKIVFEGVVHARLHMK